MSSRVSQMECEFYDLTCFGDPSRNQSECEGTQVCSDGERHCFVTWEEGGKEPEEKGKEKEAQEEEGGGHRGHSSGHHVQLMGCWTNSGYECNRECIDNRHRGSGAGEGKNRVCCCEGRMCNANFHWAPPPFPPSTPKSPTTPTNIGSGDTSPAVLLAVLVPLVIIFLIAVAAVLCWVRRRRKRDRECLGVPDEATAGGGANNKPIQSDYKDTDVDLDELKYRGRFSTVYRGRLKKPGSTEPVSVAVKVFELANRTSWQAEQEIYKLPRMDHEGVLQFMGVLHKNSGDNPLKQEFWLMTKFHTNGSLCDFLKANTVTFPELCRVAYSMAAGLAYLHEELPIRGVHDLKPAVAHRDFKSKNVLIKEDLTACIGDFGLAIIFEPGKSCGDTHGQVGTSRYMAPEVLEGAINFSRDSFLRIDMYACGLVLWELASRCTFPPGSTSIQPPSDFRMAFSQELASKPCSIPAMSELVVDAKIRPVIPDTWSSHSGLWELAATVKDCWDQDAEARLSASNVKERIRSLKDEYGDGVEQTGPSLNSGEEHHEMTPLISNGNAVNNSEQC